MMIFLPFIGNQVKVQRNDGYNDTFSFQAPADLPGYNTAIVGISTITQGQIGISSCLIGGFGYYGTLQAADFAVVTSVSEFNAAAGSTAKIIYNSSNGDLYYNADGATAGLGNGSQFAVVQGTPALNTADFQVQW
jgi:Ca2+-binding RTX toxin-like protein